MAGKLPSSWPDAKAWRARAALLAFAALSLGACAWFPSARAAEHEALQRELGRDPAKLLRELAAVDAERSRALVKSYRAELTGLQQLRLLRHGLADQDERVVFGACRLLDQRQLPVPEVADAAAVVVPRLGEPDCPVTTDDAELLVGSGDFAALLPAIRRLPTRKAVWFLHELHREARPDAVPALCELARTSDAAVRRAALSTASMTVLYSDEHAPLLTETFVACVGRRPEPEADAHGLDGSLRAALRAHLDLPRAPKPREGVLDTRPPELPTASVRWLLQSEPGPADLPLLARLMREGDGSMAGVAAWVVGALRDDATRALLAGDRPDGVGEFAWTAARARSGDVEALEDLFAGDVNHVVQALVVASPTRRAQYFDDLVDGPAERAVEAASELGWWPAGDVYMSIRDPLYDDRWFEGLEPRLAAAEALAPRVLVAFVDALPCCQTARLADRLLEYPATELFAGQDGDVSWRNCGNAGVWAFLEVTRPAAFRARLREGLGGPQAVHDTCVRLLVSLGECQPVDDVLAWLDESRDAYGELLLRLAARRDPALVERLELRVRAPEASVIEPRWWLAALAVARGMPVEVAESWEVAPEQLDVVRDAVLQGDAVAAYLASRRGGEPWTPFEPAFWDDARIREHVLRCRAGRDMSTENVFQLDLALTIADGDRGRIARALQPVRDGRYGTHNGVAAELLARAWGVSELEFLIDQLGSNCCKCSFVDEVFVELFGWQRPMIRERTSEPTSGYLRRTLLPVADRLRWSAIAQRYVVAGR